MKESVNVRDLPIDSYDTLAVIDGTWKQAKSMARRMKDKGFRHVRIDSYETMFWRYQSLNRTYLATIEAIYYFFKEYAIAQDQQYDGRYDNLLFYFKLKWQIIQKHYNINRDRKFTAKHALANSYIKYENSM
jgi:DTW domain-containing protein YfiP